jgi:hypothetical protein
MAQHYSIKDFWLLAFDEGFDRCTGEQLWRGSPDESE